MFLQHTHVDTARRTNGYDLHARWVLASSPCNAMSARLPHTCRTARRLGCGLDNPVFPLWLFADRNSYDLGPGIAVRG